jgi:hypothetical protein
MGFFTFFIELLGAYAVSKRYYFLGVFSLNRFICTAP